MAQRSEMEQQNELLLKWLVKLESRLLVLFNELTLNMGNIEEREHFYRLENGWFSWHFYATRYIHILEKGLSMCVGICIVR